MMRLRRVLTLEELSSAACCSGNSWEGSAVADKVAVGVILLYITISLFFSERKIFRSGFTSKSSRRYLRHFDGVERMAGFSFCDNRAELVARIRDALAAEVTAEDSRATTQYFLFRDEVSYAQRLQNLVRKVLDQDLARKLG